MVKYYLILIMTVTQYGCRPKTDYPHKYQYKYQYKYQHKYQLCMVIDW